MIARGLQIIFFALLVRPLILLWVGLNVRGREKLPLDGPAVLIANHNSHYDTLALMSLYPLARLHRVRPVAAADYFLKPGLGPWIARTFFGILPIVRGGNGEGDPLAPCCAALDAGEILIIYPEGTRGEPEQLARFKSGIARLAEQQPHVPIIPIFLHGFGKVLPKGAMIPVPIFCDVFIGDPAPHQHDPDAFLRALEAIFAGFSRQFEGSAWD